MALARQAIQARYSKLKFAGFPKNPPRLSSFPDNGWVYDFCQVGSEPVIGWGVFFIKEDADWIEKYEPVVSIFEGVYVAIEFPSPVSRPKPETFAEWHLPAQHEAGEEFEALKLCSFETVKGDFATNFPAWVADQFGEARQLISATRKS